MGRLSVFERKTALKSTSINFEWIPTFNNHANYKNSLSFGVDIETGGHVFQLHLTNSQGMFERAFIGETIGKWSQGDIYFGFNMYPLLVKIEEGL